VEKWTGMVVRCKGGEQGNVPRAASSNSPDIAISGTKPFSDPSILTNPSNYDKVYDNKLYINLPNYLYVRGKNFTDKDFSGTWNLFWSTPNILLYPYLWEKNQLATSSGNQSPAFTVKAGAIGASTDPFTWVPPQVQDHYCLIGIANTPDHGNPVKGVNNITNLAEVLANNANIAQRNVQIITGNVPQVVSTAGYDQGSEPSKIDLAVIFKNLPKGSSYTVGSGTPLNGKPLYHEDSNTKDNNFKYAWTDLEVPAQWNTIFNYTLTFGKDWSGIPAGAFPEVTIRGELVQETTDRLYHMATNAERHPITRKARLDATGGPVKLITVGSVTTQCPDVKPR